jgi:hypothetical protein
LQKPSGKMEDKNLPGTAAKKATLKNLFWLAL